MKAPEGAAAPFASTALSARSPTIVWYACTGASCVALQPGRDLRLNAWRTNRQRGGGWRTARLAEVEAAGGLEDLRQLVRVVRLPAHCQQRQRETLAGPHRIHNEDWSLEMRRNVLRLPTQRPHTQPSKCQRGKAR